MIVRTWKTTEGQQPPGNRATAPQEQTAGPVPDALRRRPGPTAANGGGSRGRVAPNHPRGIGA